MALGCCAPLRRGALAGFTAQRRHLWFQLAVFKDESCLQTFIPAGSGERDGQTKRQQMR